MAYPAKSGKDVTEAVVCLGKRFGFPDRRLAELVGDRQFFYRKRPIAKVETLLNVLGGIGCNFRDLADELLLEPLAVASQELIALKRVVRTGHGRLNRRFDAAWEVADSLWHVYPERIDSYVRNITERISGALRAARAAAIWGPSLRAIGRPRIACEVLKWALPQAGHDPPLQGILTQRLGYAEASCGYLDRAFLRALDTERQFLELGDIARASTAVVDSAVWALNLGKLKRAEFAYRRALDVDCLPHRNRVAALEGLALTLIRLSRSDEAAELLEQIPTELPIVDQGKIRWAAAKIKLHNEDHEGALQDLITAAKQLRDVRSEDAFTAQVEAIVLALKSGQNWSELAIKCPEFCFHSSDMPLAETTAIAGVSNAISNGLIRRFQRRFSQEINHEITFETCGVFLSGGDHHHIRRNVSEGSRVDITGAAVGLAEHLGINRRKLGDHSGDRDFFYRKRKIAKVDTLLNVLGEIGCNFRDLADEMLLEPSAVASQKLIALKRVARARHGRLNRSFDAAWEVADRLWHVCPERINSYVRNITERISGTLRAARAAAIWGPGLRAIGRPRTAREILRWALTQASDDPPLQGILTQRLGYAEASCGYLDMAFLCALDSERQFLELGDVTRASAAVVDSAVWALNLGELKRAEFAYRRALDVSRLPHRNRVAALEGLALTLIRLSRGDEAAELLGQIPTELPTVDQGKIRWAAAKIKLHNKDHEGALHDLMSAAKQLRDVHSEDALAAHLEAILLAMRMERNWTELARNCLTFCVRSSDVMLAQNTVAAGMTGSLPKEHRDQIMVRLETSCQPFRLTGKT